MAPRSVGHRRHCQALEACVLQIHSWKPFQLESPRPLPYPKKPCLSNRSTAPDLDLSRLSILDDASPPPPISAAPYRWVPSKRHRHRRGSRSASGRSSDRSTTRRVACTEFHLAAGGTDSSGELFHGEGGSCWGSDASEARLPRRESRDVAAVLIDREGLGYGSFHGTGAATGGAELPGSESGYGSEPGYRGDGELGYDDSIDEEEDDGRVLFWGTRVGDSSRLEVVNENNFAEQKSQYRCRRKKHDLRPVAPWR